jgi:hypothetical protein
MAEQTGRGLRFEQRMSDLEALMWNIEKDPRLNPSGGAVMVYDRPLDAALLRSAFALADAEIPRLRERVVPGLGRLSPPRGRSTTCSSPGRCSARLRTTNGGTLRWRR